MMFLKMLLTFFKGIMVGMCNVIPGVSGGTLVVVFNIYEQFMDITSLNFKKIIKNWKFSVPLLLGMLSGILIFSKVITFFYTRFPNQTMYFFTGLILGSIPLLSSLTFKNKDHTKQSTGKIISLVICAIAGIAIIYGFSILQKKFGSAEFVNSSLPDFSWSLAVKIFIAGVLGAVAMIIPGISGALLMLIMGVYPIVIAAIPELVQNLPGIFSGNAKPFLHALILLLPNGIGVLAGLVAGSNLLKLLLRKLPNHTYGVILGLIAGSLITVFPGFTCIQNVGQGFGCAVCLILGFAMAFFSTKFSDNESEKSKEKEPAPESLTEAEIARRLNIADAADDND